MGSCVVYERACMHFYVEAFFSRGGQPLELIGDELRAKE